MHIILHILLNNLTLPLLCSKIIFIYLFIFVNAYLWLSNTNQGIHAVYNKQVCFCPFKEAVLNFKYTVFFNLEVLAVSHKYTEIKHKWLDFVKCHPTQCKNKPIMLVFFSMSESNTLVWYLKCCSGISLKSCSNLFKAFLEFLPGALWLRSPDSDFLWRIGGPVLGSDGSVMVRVSCLVTGRAHRRRPGWVQRFHSAQSDLCLSLHVGACRCVCRLLLDERERERKGSFFTPPWKRNRLTHQVDRLSVRTIRLQVTTRRRHLVVMRCRGFRIVWVPAVNT